MKAFAQPGSPDPWDKLKPELKIKLTEIDTYVKRINNNIKLVRVTSTSEYTDGKIGEDISYFTDSTYKTILKVEGILPSKYKLYYRNGELIYEEYIIPQQTDNETHNIINVSYYENNKLLFKSNSFGSVTDSNKY